MNLFIISIFLIVVFVFGNVDCDEYLYPFCGVNIENANIIPDDVSDLKMVQTIIRHGARTPVGNKCVGVLDGWTCSLTHSEKPSFNSDSYVYNKLWTEDRNFYSGNCGIGILTELGYNQQVKNGQFLRKMYKGFLPDTVSKAIFDDIFYIRSTDYPRTFLSAESLLTGLYPVDKREHTFSLDIHTMDEVMENLLVNPVMCPKSATYKKEFEESSFLNDYFQKYQVPLQKNVAQNLSIPFDSFNMMSQSDCWMSAVCNGYTLDEGITKPMLEQAVTNAVFYFGEGFKYPDRIETARTGLGNFVQEFTERFMDSYNMKDDTKFVLYSAHDTTIMPFLIALDIWDGEWPPFGSIITSEFYSNSTHQSVRFTYNGKVLSLPGCLEYCPFDKFRELVKQVAPTREDCQVSFKGETDLFSVF